MFVCRGHWRRTVFFPAGVRLHRELVDEAVPQRRDLSRDVVDG